MTAAHDVLSELLRERHSVRAFKTEPVPRHLLEKMMVTAQRTGSWCNAQSWQVAFVSGDRLRRLADRLYEHASSGAETNPDFAFPDGYPGVYRDRRRACGYALYASIGIARDDRKAGAAQMLENFRFFGAPHAAIITTLRDLGPYGALDCGGYVANLLAAAQALGIGAVPQASTASYPDLVRDEIDLPPERAVVCSVAIGWSDTSHPINSFRTDRASLDEAVDWIGEVQ